MWKSERVQGDWKGLLLTSLIVSTQEKATDVRCADSMGPIKVPPIQMPQVMVRDWPSPKIEEVIISQSQLLRCLRWDDMTFLEKSPSSLSTNLTFKENNSIGTSQLWIARVWPGIPFFIFGSEGLGFLVYDIPSPLTGGLSGFLKVHTDFFMTTWGHLVPPDRSQFSEKIFPWWSPP